LTAEAEISYEDSQSIPLFTAINLETVRLRNRIGFAPLNTGLFGEQGLADPRGLAFYEQYCQEEIGAIYIGGIAVCATGRANRRSLALDSENKATGLKQVISLAHRKDTNVIVQLEHAGRQANPLEIGATIVAPSPIACPVVGIPPQELTHEEIHRIVKDFGRAALLAERCGAGIVEVHAAHGYLISGFLSPYSNHREDEYGGSTKNRFRFLKQILEEIRSCAKLPVGIRINSKENFETGLDLQDCISGLLPLKDLIAYVSVSGGVYVPDGDLIIPSRQLPRALWRDAALRIKRELGLPIFICGNIDSVALANQLISDTVADVVLMGRSLLADPLLVVKSINGRLAEIQECTDCGLCKWHFAGRDSIYCPFNKVLRC
jgi:NADPH2 dehydrogenase